MFRPDGMAPPLSPVLIAGLLARPLPPVLLQPFLDVAMAGVRRQHPQLFGRLGAFAGTTVLIDPIDLPLLFALRLDVEAATLRALRDGEGVKAAAILRAPLLVLIDLLEGRLDGDALFFSRELVIEGDTEVIVALRNAVDDAQIDLVEDVACLFGPFSGPARRFGHAARSLLDQAHRDFEVLRTAVLAPALRRIEAEAARRQRLEARLDRTPSVPDREAARRHARIAP